MSVLQAPSRPTGTPPASSAATDARLLRRLRAGDQSAFEAIFKHHYPPLLSFCRHMLGNQQEAEDTLQQTFLRAHRALLRNSPPRELRPWLYAVARNCCLSAIAARRPTAEFEDGTSLLGLSDQVREREDLRELLADMARLPTAQRSALLLAELDDLSHQEIASIVECPVSKVKALIYQARSSLIAARDARNTPCQDIREQLAVARGGELRRGPLRRHLSQCVGCRDFQEAVSIQRQSLAVLLPVLPSAAVLAKILGGALGSGVMATGTGATAGGGVVAGGSASLAGTTATGATATGAAATVSAGAGTGTGALLGGGVAVKAAVTGALALATVGAVAAHTRFAHANPNKNVRHTQLRSASPRSHRVRRVGGSERSQLATTVPSTGSLTASHGQSPSSIGTNPPEPQAPVGGVPPLTLTAQIPGGSGANALLLAGSSPSLASPSESAANKTLTTQAGTRTAAGAPNARLERSRLLRRARRQARERRIMLQRLRRREARERRRKARERARRLREQRIAERKQHARELRERKLQERREREAARLVAAKKPVVSRTPTSTPSTSPSSTGTSPGTSTSNTSTGTSSTGTVQPSRARRIALEEQARKRRIEEREALEALRRRRRAELAEKAAKAEEPSK